MRIVEAGPDDSPQLAALHARTFDRPWKSWELRRVLLTPGTFALGAWSGEELWGMAVGRVIATDAEILTIGVDEPRRERGVGRALTRGVAAQAIARGAERLFLEVAVDNAAALALYRGQGFEPVGLRKGYYVRKGAEAVDAQVLSLSLPPARA